MNRNFLKEAIADAKTVKESAIANAKVALEEAFSPKLQAMFAQKLEEMDQEEMDEEYDEVDEAREVDEKMSNPVMRRGLKGDNTAEKETEDMREEEDMSLDEILAELEKEDLREDERTDAEEEGYLDGMKEEDEDMEVEEDEDIDLENMSEEDLKSFIEDVIADMVKAGELEAGDAIEDEDDVETEEDEDIKEAKEVNGKKSMDEGLLDFLKKKKKEAPKAEDSPKLVGVDFDGNYIYSDDPNISKKSYAKLGEDDRTDAEGMTEAEKVDIEDNEDIDVDIEKDIEIDDVENESDIEVDSKLAGKDSDVAAVLGLLTKAQEEAKSLGDEKLMDQIGNTITYYTRAHVVAEVNIDVDIDNPAEDAEIGMELEEGAADNLEIKSLAKTLYSGFKKMGADVELTASKMRLNKRPSNGNLDSKDVFIYAGDEAVEVNLVGEKAGGFFDKIQKDFPKFEFKDRGDSKTWEDKTVKNLAIYPGKGMSEALNEEFKRFQKLAGIIK